MRNGIVGLLLLFTLATPPVVVRAQSIPNPLTVSSASLTDSERTATIAQLKQLILQLTQQLQAIIAARAGGSATSACALARTLGVGSRGSDVAALQQFLITQGLLAPDAGTGYFGLLTQAAVQAYQTNNGIVRSGTPATTGFGAVGPKTRAYLASHCHTAPVAPTPTPTQPQPSPTTTPTALPPTATPSSCSFNAQSVPHGGSVTAFRASSVPFGSQCVSEVRTCTNGVLSGSASSAACVVAGKYPADRVSFVQHLFSCVLERPLSDSDARDWVSKYFTTTSLEGLYRQFFDSPEYLNRHTSDAHFVDQLYSCILFRNGAQAGQDFWVPVLRADHTRDYAIRQFLTSPEFNVGPRPSLLAAANMTYVLPGLSGTRESINDLYVDYFGAIGNGIDDDSGAIQQALSALAGTGGTVKLNATGKYFVGTNIYIPSNVALVGSLSHPDLPDDITSAAGYANLGGIRISPDATVVLGTNAGVEHLLIYRHGMTLPSADSSQYAGVAFTVGNNAHGAYVRSVMAIGFDWLLKSLSAGRVIIDDFNGDGTNGIYLGGSYDSSRITNVHLWPFGTVGTVFGTPSPSFDLRSGTGVLLQGPNANTHIDNIFTHGYNRGIILDNTGSISIGSVWTETGSGAHSIGVGFYTTTLNLASNITSWSVEHPLVFDLGAGRNVQIQNLQVIGGAQSANCVEVNSGDVSISSADLSECYGGTFSLNSLDSTVTVNTARLSGRYQPALFGPAASSTKVHINIVSQ